jgi:flagellar FliL protein
MAEAPTPEEEVVPAKSSKSKLIMIIVVILVLLGGGGAAWYFMQQKSAEETEAAKEAETKVTAAPVFMTLETFTVNLLPDPGEQYLQTDISLQLTESANESLVKQIMPLVKAHILMILSSKKSSEISSVEGKNALSQEIVEAINKLLPQASKGKAISGAFFTSFIIQ